MFIGAIFITAKKWKQAKSAGTWVHEMWSSHTTECYPSRERDEVGTHDVMDLGNIG